MLQSQPLLRLAAALFLSITVQSATAAPVAFSFTGSINYMYTYTQADNSSSQVSSSMFPGALIQMNDVFTGMFYYDDSAPLEAFQQAQPADGTFLRYEAPAANSGLTMTGSSNGLSYTSQSSSEFFVSDMVFGDSTSIFNFSVDQQFVKHAGIDLFGPAGVLVPGRVPNTGEVMGLNDRGFSINWVELATGNQLSVNGRINTLTPMAANPVPEPLMPALFGLAAAMAIVAGRMRTGK
jgi:hypothetical protein